MLRPLQQWVCDKCGQTIVRPEDGWLEWLDGGESKAHSFKIVHQSAASPRAKGCYHHANHPDVSDVPLNEYSGEEAPAKLLTFLDLGPLHDPEGTEGVRCADVAELTEIMRRLMIPYYEEARLYWGDAREDGFFDGANEVWPYLPRNLRALIEEYGER